MQEIYEQQCGFKWGWKESLTIDGAEFLSYVESKRETLGIQTVKVMDKGDRGGILTWYPDKLVILNVSR